jgi:hypothetical protein
LRSHFLQQFRTAVDYRKQILQVRAGNEITAASAFEGFEFGGQKERSGDAPDTQRILKGNDLSGLQGFGIPTVRKSKDLFVQGDYIENQFAISPPAQRRSFVGVLSEANLF